MTQAPLHKHFFKTRDLMFCQLSNRIAAKLTESISSRGQASIVLSGGSTPIPLFELLRETTLPWDKITITLADERWVDIESDASNEKLIKNTLMSGKAGNARFLSLKSDHSTPEAGESTIEKRLQELDRPFDVVVLGMGDDGHTASLFPEGDNLQTALYPEDGALCRAMNAPGAPQPRITLTLPALLNCRDLVLLCTGQSKQDTFKTANNSGPVEDMPIRAILRQNKQAIAYYWAP